MAFNIIYITNAREDEAQQLSDALIERKLVACANIFPIRSAFWWQQAVQHENEWVAIVKTTPEKWTAVREAVEALHPYEVPCIMKFEVEANDAYERWIRESVG